LNFTNATASFNSCCGVTNAKLVWKIYKDAVQVAGGTDDPVDSQTATTASESLLHYTVDCDLTANATYKLTMDWTFTSSNCGTFGGMRETTTQVTTADVASCCPGISACGTNILYNDATHQRCVAT
jgi:hypothetical protein